MNFGAYEAGGFYDEMFDGGRGAERSEYSEVKKLFESLTEEDFKNQKNRINQTFLEQGITFQIYQEDSSLERIFPFDPIPRLITKKEWEKVEQGLIQRITALNIFLNDIYNDGHIVNDGILPRETLYSSANYLENFIGFKPSKNIYIHISGSDLIRDNDGKFYVLEDNLRCPSGVSYVLENRSAMKRAYPDLYRKLNIAPVDDYSQILQESLKYISPSRKDKPTIVLLSPGIHNSAYFEHTFLARQMGVEIVEAKDLIVSGGYVYMRTTKGLVVVDVIYRRIDDDYLDPNHFNEESLLGVPGITDAYLKGNVALANAIGAGVADDKVIYAYVPDIIKYYLAEDPILPNVPTYLASVDSQKEHILGNLENLVVKTANDSGGHGMLMGPSATKDQIQKFSRLIKNNPRNYIAQPVVQLSRHPTIFENKIEGRHVDLRPFVIYGDKVKVLKGGLTRVALEKDSLIVNSSQGGGSKDTCVLM